MFAAESDLTSQNDRIDSKMEKAGDNEQDDAEEQLRNHVICVCEKRQLITYTAIGAVLLFAMVVVGAVCGSGACASSSSSSSSSDTASSRENDFGGSMPTNGSLQNMTAPMATPATASPTNAPTLQLVKPSPTMPPSASVTTPAPIQNSGPAPTLTPTMMPVASPPTVVSSTMQTIRNSGVLRCGVYDVTWSEDNNDATFSIDLVR
jgi:TctA family transporter